MEVKEIDSFIQKFRNLWKSGLSAHLDLDTHSGEAWVGLRVRLGHPSHHQVQQLKTNSRNSPCRQRRRDRRTAARKEEAEKAKSTGLETEEVLDKIDAEKDHSKEQSISTAEEASVQLIESVEHLPEVEHAPANTDVEESEINLSNICTEVEDICNDDENIAVVHAVATFENCPNDGLCQDDVNSLQKFVQSEEHLTRNISRMEIDQTDRWEVAVRLFVLTNNLSEAPRSYIRKHLGGQNFWDRSNGTKIRLIKIHQK